MTLASKIEANAEVAFAEFRQRELENEKYQVFDHGFKIGAYTCLYEYLVSGIIAKRDEEDLKILDAHGKWLLTTLYDEYVNDGEASIDNWGGIDDLIRGFVEREKRE